MLSKENQRYEKEHPLLGNLCPITGRRPEVHPSWIVNRENYRSRLGVLEPGVVVNFAVGYTLMSDARVFYQGLDAMKARGLVEDDWVLVEDYTLHTGASLEARTFYINHMNTVVRPKAIIFITQSKLWRISIRGGLLLTRTKIPIIICANYAQALEKAAQILGRPLLGVSNENDPGERPGFSKDGFSFWLHAERGDHILATYGGKPTAELIPQITQLYHNFINRTLARCDSRNYVSIHDFRGMERTSFAITMAFVRGMFPRQRIFRPRLSVVVGKGRWMQVGVGLTRILSNALVYAVGTLDEAEKLVFQHGNVRPASKPSKADEEQIELVGQALDLLDNLRWDRPGYEVPLAAQANSPIQSLARAIVDLKLDVDTILRQSEAENSALEQSEATERRIAQESEAALAESRLNRKRLASLARENMSIVMEISRTQREMLEVLSGILDRRAGSPAGTTLGMARVAALIGRKAGLTDVQAENLYYATCVHDVGLLGMPDRVARNSDQRTDDDEALYRQHPEIGAEVLGHLKGDVLRMAAQATLTHQEHWDGSGYPRGLAGNQIPLSGRLLRAAEMIEELLMRPDLRRETLGGDSFSLHLRMLAGRELDPALVDCALMCMDELRQLMEPQLSVGIR